MSSRVIVLLSAYNGEKTIAQQINSVLSQLTWGVFEVKLFVRDDGSTDGTLAILDDYAARGLIDFEKGENVGFIESFLTLIAHAGEADYYAFCDQDDVWLPEKLAYAIDMLQTRNPDTPNLYFSNYDFYDSEMRFSAHHDGKLSNISFRNALVDCPSLGITCVFNRTARDMVVENRPKHSCGHDWWMYMLCSGLGQVVYDERPTVQYRRTGHNVSDAGDSFLRFQLWRFRKFFIEHYFRQIREQMREFEAFYADRLSEDNRKLLALFTCEGFHPCTALKKVFFHERFRQGSVDEIFVRVCFLLGEL